MTVAKALKGAPVAALRSSVPAQAAAGVISITVEDGEQIAIFNVGDSCCVLKTMRSGARRTSSNRQERRTNACFTSNSAALGEFGAEPGPSVQRSGSRKGLW